MRIDGQHGHQFVRPKSSQPSEGATHANQATGREEARTADTNDPKSQTLSLVRQLENSPEIRENRLREVAVHLRQGTYLTRQVAEDTASAIWNAIQEGRY